MKVIKKGSGKKIWSRRYSCTGKGNGGGGCGTLLQVYENDLYTTSSSHYDGSTEHYTTFTCPCCDVETDIKRTAPPSRVQIPTKAEYIKRMKRLAQKERNKVKTEIKETIRVIPNWPKEGINFLDITTAIKDGKTFHDIIDEMAELIKNEKIDKIVVIEARGFVFGPVLAYIFGPGVVLARKKGKLPGETVSRSYGLEYGQDVIEIHKDAITAGDRVLIVDDVLATGGTAEAVLEIVEELGGKVIGLLFLIEIEELNGRNKFNGYKVLSSLKY